MSNASISMMNALPITRDNLGVVNGRRQFNGSKWQQQFRGSKWQQQFRGHIFKFSILLDNIAGATFYKPIKLLDLSSNPIRDEQPPHRLP